MPKGYPNPKPEITTTLPPVEEYDAYAPRTAPDPNPVDTVRLLRHYRPMGAVTIEGYLKPEKKRKNPAGVEVIVEPEEFVKGEACPAPFPGAGFVDKIWASTVITLPRDEAKGLVRSGIAVREYAD